MGTWDLGVDVGGAILKDRIWYYAGLAVTHVDSQTERRGRRQLYDGMGGARSLGNFECPTYLADPRFCDGAAALAKETEELDYVQTQIQTRTVFNAIAKLQFHLATDQDLFVNYIASPTLRETFYEFGTGDDSSRFSESNQIHDLSVRYQGKTFGKRLQIDLAYAMHYQSQTAHRASALSGTSPVRPRPPDAASCLSTMAASMSRSEPIWERVFLEPLRRCFRLLQQEVLAVPPCSANPEVARFLSRVRAATSIPRRSLVAFLPKRFRARVRARSMKSLRALAMTWDSISFCRQATPIAV